MAFSVAQRAVAVPLLLVNGTYRKFAFSYLDSSTLQHQLQRLNDDGSLKGSLADRWYTLEIPIFWFIHCDPLLIDKHYQAKALSDMVIVVQSESLSWESHLQCNGKSVLWNLRMPIKAALAAVSEHLAGLLPLHLVYSHAYETAIEDWIWSVGCNPFSVTSQGWHISKFQLDTIAWSYIFTTVEESIQLVNSALHLLVIIPTLSRELSYIDALRLLRTLEDVTRGFADQVNTTISLLHPIHCTPERQVDVTFDWTTIPAFLIVLGVLYMMLKPRRPKP